MNYYNSDYIISDRTDENGTSVYMDSSYVAYAEKSNVLDKRLDIIMIMLIYSIVFFAFAGAVICL